MSEPRTSLAAPAGWLSRQAESEDSPGAAYLLLVTAIALALRLLRLDGMSPWIDEIFTWEMVAPGQGLDFGAQILAAYQGPLYHAAVWPLLRLSDSAFMLRLPAALAGTAAVPLLGLLTARLWDRMTGRLAALLLAISPFGIWYAQEARGYSFVILFAIAAALVLLTAVRQGLTGGRIVAFALLCFAGLASNFSFLFLMVAFGVTVLLIDRPRTLGAWTRWGLAFGGGILLAGPWLLEAAGIWEVGRVMPGATMGAALRGDSTFHPGALPFTGFALLNGFTLGPSLAELHRPDRLAVVRDHVPALLAGTVPAAVALLAALGRLDRRRWVVVLWILIPLACVTLLAVRNVKPYNVRYAAVALPWVIALLACGVGALRGRARTILSVALCLVFLISLGGLYLDDRFAKADVRAAVAAIAPADGQPRTVLVPAVGPVVHHYWRDGVEVLGCWDEPTVTDAAQADSLVARQLAGHDDVWVIWARSWYLDPQHRLPAALTRRGTLERVFAGPNVAVDRWRRRPDPSPEQTP